MNIGSIAYKPVSFGKQPEIIVSKNQRHFEMAKQLDERLSRVIREIDGIGSANNTEEKILKATQKIGKLRKETIDAWRSCPQALKPKLEALDRLRDELDIIQHSFRQLNEAMDNEPQGLIIPGGKEKEGSKGGLITDPGEIASGYGQLPKEPSEALKILQGKVQPKKASFVTVSDVKKVTDILTKETFSFEELNKVDSELYKKMEGTLLIGQISKEMDSQVDLINKKLTDIKENKGILVPQVGVKVYLPETTGKIMALETAKLRREALKTAILLPGIGENLDKPDVMLQPLPTGEAIAFKIDKSFVPGKQEIKEILKLNESYKPVLSEMFPDGLPVYIVPGYMNDKFGDIEGGMSIPHHPEKGVWLISYDIKDRYAYTKMQETTKASLENLTTFKPSVLKGNPDRARALAHEIGHAISFNLMDKKLEDNSKDSGSIIITPTADVNFMTAWQGLRMGSKYNNQEKTKLFNRGYGDNAVKALNMAVDYETIAEDIRIAITGDQLPASSKMTGVYDQSEAGKVKQNSVLTFIKNVLLNKKSVTEAMFDNISGEIKPA
ncbi:MAG: hypothetical protein AB1782_00970 [Cyanobacteriota bacterium]